ncbi:MAG: GDSL-type esterase/lipase family protein [Clostridiales bacterium]|nr:GDSL-type esterase/lipase family protein [Clostridiales bacterium]
MIEIKDNSKILFLGDSITDIKFNRRENRKIHGKNIYALQVSKELKKKHKGLKFFYKGIASNRTYHVYDRLTKDCIDLKPDVIVMLIGVNDAWENYVPEQYPPLNRPIKEHMSEIYRRFSAELANTRLLVLLPFLIDSVEEKMPFHRILNNYIEILSEMARENGAEIVDLQAEFNKAQAETEPQKLSLDGIHPTDLGHSVIALAVLKHFS